MNNPMATAMRQLQMASQLLQSGKFVPARELLEQVLRVHPHMIEAHRMLGGAMLAAGDKEGAERVLRGAIVLSPRTASLYAALGDVLFDRQQMADAERIWRIAVELDPSYARTVVRLSWLLLGQGRATEVEELLGRLSPTVRDNPDLLAVQGRALLMLRRPLEAVEVCHRMVRSVPSSGVAELELAMALEDAGRSTAAEAAARNALEKGHNVPETHFALGNALLKQDRMDEAEAAFRHAIAMRSDYAAAHYNLAQIVWMRRSDLGAAVATLDASLRSAPAATDLVVVKAKLLEYAGDINSALAILKEAIARGATDPRLHLAAAEAALRFDSVQAAEWARRTLALQPGNARALATLGDAQLGLGQPHEALRIVDDLLKLDPDDGRAIALQATAWRVLGDPRYRELYNYPEFVRVWTIDTPGGWPDLASYLADLARSLRGLHQPLHTHPIEQSLRQGTQSNQDLMHSDDPTIRAFFQAVDGPIRRHLVAIGTGTDAHRRRNNGGYRISGAWSVRLQPNGYHVDHLHPQGWLSSACHIHIPEAVRRGGHEGWIKFGEPGVPTIPSLAAERYEQPEPGKLVLFPSYMWHGTVPFSGKDTDERLTIAFDVVPA